MVLFYKPYNRYIDVYDVTYDKNGYPHFLVYDDEEWKLFSAKHFRPARKTAQGRA